VMVDRQSQLLRKQQSRMTRMTRHSNPTEPSLVKKATETQSVVRHRSYDEACRDITAAPAERENALLTEHVRAVRQIEWLWAACKIVYWPKDGSYPIEHNPPARKYSRDTIEAQMPNAKPTDAAT